MKCPNPKCGRRIFDIEEMPPGNGWAAGEKYGEKIFSVLKAVVSEGEVQFMENLREFQVLCKL